MVYLVGAQFFGHEFPKLGILVPIAILVVLFLLFNRNGGLDAGGAEGGKAGRGRMHQCTRCGRNFQPEQVEVMSNGAVKTSYDDRCPNCGWDLDWGDADHTKRPGGASGGW